MLNHIINKIVLLIFIIKFISLSQTADFVSVKNGEFDLKGARFYPLGTNAYYLHKYACAGDTNSIHELFKNMNNLGMNVLRTWAFNDGGDENDIFTLQYAPYKYNEKSFQKLDYVIYTAKEYNIKIILTFVNNWNDFGGMHQYLKWYAAENYSLDLQNGHSDKSFSKTKAGNYYEKYITETINHDDFYKSDSIKTWYKAYINYVLNRKNIFTNITYKNEDAIMAFELANEPESSDNTGMIVYNWVSEMSEYFKSIDKNHLLSTGESGFDIDNKGYGKHAAWLINGEKGISFKKNSTLNNIDYTTAHLYSEVWSNLSGPEWIFDHNIISRSYGKPFLLGEYGAKNKRELNFNSWLISIRETNSGGALLWQLTPANFKADDGYALNYLYNSQDCNTIKYNYDLIRNRNVNYSSNSKFSNIYPNPANREFYVRFLLDEGGVIRYSLFNILGELCFSDNRNFSKGGNVLLLSGNKLANGVYFLKIESGNRLEVRKVIIVR